ncbi:MAG: hypothetical protein ACKVOU_07860 [Cytophagales bacterium]
MHYNWKRHWLPIPSTINYDYEGFPYYNVKQFEDIIYPAYELEELNHLPCLILLGDPQMGKSTILKEIKISGENIVSLTYELNKRKKDQDLINEIEKK